MKYAKGSEREPQIKDQFCKELERLGVVASAAKAVGLNVRTIYRWREQDSDFAAAWDDAYEMSTAALEAGIYERAIHGTNKPVYQKGRLVGEYREYSVEREKMLWRVRKPELFRTNIEELIDKQQVVLQFQPLAEPEPIADSSTETPQPDGTQEGGCENGET